MNTARHYLALVAYAEIKLNPVIIRSFKMKFIDVTKGTATMMTVISDKETAPHLQSTVCYVLRERIGTTSTRKVK